MFHSWKYFDLAGDPKALHSILPFTLSLVTQRHNKVIRAANAINRLKTITRFALFFGPVLWSEQLTPVNWLPCRMRLLLLLIGLCCWPLTSMLTLPALLPGEQDTGASCCLCYRHWLRESKTEKVILLHLTIHCWINRSYFTSPLKSCLLSEEVEKKREYFLSIQNNSHRTFSPFL